MSKKMTQADNFWLCMDEPVNLMVITGFWEFEEPLDYNRLYATVEARLAPFPRFRQKVVKAKSGLGLPRWVDDRHYDLSSHLHRIALPEPGDKNELSSLISDLMTVALDPNKPLWDIHLIENYKSGCVLFFRLHHCIADGIALMHVLHSTADTEADAPWPKPSDQLEKHSLRKSPLFSFNDILSGAKEAVKKGQDISKKIIETGKFAANPAGFKFLMKAASGLPADVAAVLSKHTIMNSDPDTAFKGGLRVAKQVTWTDPIDLDRIKKLGKAISSATLNDILIATVTGSMRRYLKSRNTPVNELDLQVTVPVNIRKPGKEFELGNKFSLVFLKLPVYLEDPVLRLKEVKRRMDKLKVSADPFVNFGMLSAVGYLPESLAKKAAHFFGNKASGVMTNVPGPKNPLYFAGKEIRNIMFWVPRSGKIGLGISILSYNGRVTVGIASDKGLMPDPETLLEGFEEEFNYLVDIVRSGKIYEGPLVLHDRFAEKEQDKEKSGEEENGQERSEKENISEQDSSGRCQAFTKEGKRCRNKATGGESFCHAHREYRQEERLLHDVKEIMRELSD
ncbi:MAG: wax ester/triacylglycerol synthase family O-acyltransferase [Desulfococcaceae bacterium]|jgi:WS/DGAT/MGAT family acyltransferase|nr:wax ester/triacylglycerol synthase family O-acyltransferase [Desulfococcaceae bacterium]